MRVAAAATGVTILDACGGRPNGSGDSDGPPIALGVCTARTGQNGVPAIETYRTNAGAYPASLLWYQDWEGYPTFQRPVADAAVAAGAVPQLTWQPRYTAGGNQADFALTKIADGAHDSYLKSFADVVPSWGKRLYIRFAQEMIGDWYHGVLVCTATLPLTMSPLGVTSTRSSPRGGHQREVGVVPKL